MKKLIACLLIACLLAPCAAFANAEETPHLNISPDMFANLFSALMKVQNPTSAIDIAYKGEKAADGSTYDTYMVDSLQGVNLYYQNGFVTGVMVLATTTSAMQEIYDVLVILFNLNGTDLQNVLKSYYSRTNGFYIDDYNIYVYCSPIEASPYNYQSKIVPFVTH